MENQITIAERIENGLSGVEQEGVVKVLASTLADQHVLYLKLRNFHWNLKGARFHSLHEMFEEQYEALAEAIDETAERIRMLGGVAPGSMKEMLDLATLTESDGEVITGNHALRELVADHEATIRNLRAEAEKTEEALGDQATADFLIEMLQAHEKFAWMLRSSIDDSEQ
ncbi:MAG: DNA starvation/stationary phase protection protein [Verrucomicrobiota bacterium]